MPEDLTSFIKNVLSQTDIVDIIQSKISLKKSGSNYQALCPFHNENSPSFSVNSNKQFFYCFGCQASGDAINFLMRHDNLSFMDALELLAKKIGLAIPSNNIEKKSYNPDAYKLLREMTLSCRQDLEGSPLSYLTKRGISRATMRKFHIGYCGPGYLAWFNKNATHQAKLLLSSGVGSSTDRPQLAPKFFKRLMFPIQDSTGKVIGFGGRTIDNGQPKYLNSPETDIFKKRHVLYGLYQFRELKLHEVLVVEGYMDVLALHSADIPGAVACLGTAFTLQHWHVLRKYTQKITFCFDGDRAGKAAAWKSLESILPGIDPTISVYFLFLPDQHDPDSYLKEHGRTAFLRLVEQPITWVEFFMLTLKNIHPVTTVEGKAAFLQTSQSHISKIKNTSLQTVLSHEIDQLLNIRTEKKTNSPKNPPLKKHPRNFEKIQKHAENIIIMLCSKNNAEYQPLSHLDNLIHSPLIDSINTWLEQLNNDPSISGSTLLSLLQGTPLYEQCNRLLQSKKYPYHFSHLQIELLSMRYELIERRIQQTLRQDAVSESDKPLLQSLIVSKKQLERQKHALQQSLLS